MNIIRTCMLMEQIDQLHWLKEKLGEPLPYKPDEIITTEEDLKRSFRESKEYYDTHGHAMGDSEYMLNWSKSYSVDSMIEDRVLNGKSIDPGDQGKRPGRIHHDGPMCVDVNVYGDKERPEKSTYDSDYDRFSWAALPYWIDNWTDSSSGQLSKNTLVAVTMNDYDEDMYIEANIITDDHVSYGKKFKDILNDLMSTADYEQCYVFIYDQTHAGSIKSLWKGLSYESNQWRRMMEKLISCGACSDHIELITIQSINDEDGETLQVAAHFLIRNTSKDYITGILEETEASASIETEDRGYKVYRFTSTDGVVRDMIYSRGPDGQIADMTILDMDDVDLGLDTVNNEVKRFILTNKDKLVTIKDHLTKHEAEALIEKLKKEKSTDKS